MAIECHSEDRPSSQTNDGRSGPAWGAEEQAVPGITGQLAAMTERVEHVVKQTRARVFSGNTKFEKKIVSLFEPQTEIIRKGKASKPPSSASW